MHFDPTQDSASTQSSAHNTAVATKKSRLYPTEVTIPISYGTHPPPPDLLSTLSLLLRSFVSNTKQPIAFRWTVTFRSNCCINFSGPSTAFMLISCSFPSAIHHSHSVHPPFNAAFQRMPVCSMAVSGMTVLFAQATITSRALNWIPTFAPSPIVQKQKKANDLRRERRRTGKKPT